MKKFIDPELIVERFEEDIICDSGELGGGPGSHDDGSTGTTPNDT